jgi:type IV secretory pathway VirB2 component (pilin)
MAQMLLFAVALVAIYAATRRQPEPIFIERLIGAVVASATGYMVGVFMLSRIMPEAKINLLAPGDAALRWIQTLGPMAGLILVAAVIVFGWRSLGPKGFAKRYG